jgi:acetyl esterase
MSDLGEARFEVVVEDFAYQRQAGRGLLARLYRPRGTGPFPAVVDVHGGAWVNSDRLGNAQIAQPLAASGIVVLSPDFRMPPEAPYPASMADINLAIRWLKAHAKDLGSRPELVGGFGTSSGGHQILLSAMRPTDARYAALPLAEASGIDARLGYVVSGWGVLDPLARYRLAKEHGHARFVHDHDVFWGSEAAMSEGNPALILERGERVELPPALVFQGTDDEWVPRAQTERFAAAWRKAGGALELALLPGARHSFFREDPTAPNSLKAIELIKAFVHRQAG